jgi:hypothetical protein
MPHQGVLSRLSGKGSYRASRSRTTLAFLCDLRALCGECLSPSDHGDHQITRDSGDSFAPPAIFPGFVANKRLPQISPCADLGRPLHRPWTELGRSLGRPSPSPVPNPTLLIANAHTCPWPPKWMHGLQYRILFAIASQTLESPKTINQLSSREVRQATERFLQLGRRTRGICSAAEGVDENQ